MISLHLERGSFKDYPGPAITLLTVKEQLASLRSGMAFVDLIVVQTRGCSTESCSSQSCGTSVVGLYSLMANRFMPIALRGCDSNGDLWGGGGSDIRNGCIPLEMAG